MEDEFGVVQLNCPANVLDGEPMLAFMKRDKHDKVQRIDMIWIYREYLSIDLLGTIQSPCLMMLNGNSQSFGDAAHSIRITQPAWPDRSDSRGRDRCAD